MSLTPQEEQVLRQLVRDSTPMKKPDVTLGFQPREDNFVDRQLNHLPKMQPQSINDDPIVTSRLRAAGVLHGDQTPGTIYSLGGVSRLQILTLSADALRSVVETARANAEQEGVREPKQTSFVRRDPADRPPLRVLMVG
jgi:hypothetical protein